jgi:hypothetical protein
VEGVLHVELVKCHVFSKDELLGKITFTIQDAEKILRERNVLELKGMWPSSGIYAMHLNHLHRLLVVQWGGGISPQLQHGA